MSSLFDVVTSPWHLVRRFVTSLPPTPPPVEDEVWADDHLLPGERTLWVQLSNQDRRHSIGVAQRFDDARGGASNLSEWIGGMGVLLVVGLMLWWFAGRGGKTT